MKQLFLIRHAKSSWDINVNDIERPINSRGLNDSNLVSLHVKDLFSEKKMIWCSTAKRAFQTAAVYSKNNLFSVDEIIYKDDLYTFNELRLEQIIKSCPNTCSSLVVFGHNEAITNFVNTFGNIFVENISTSGFVNIIFDSTTWNTIKNGKTNSIIFPRDLK